MRAGIRAARAVAVLGLVALASGCATRKQLRLGLEAQTQALQAERSERIAGDERLTADINRLRTDLEGLRTEFGAKISLLEEGMQFVMPVHFAYDDATVDATAQPMLTRFAQVVDRHYPGAIVTVEGFADPAGTAAYNRALSQRRADAVRAYLTTQGMVDTRLRAVGYGEDRLVVPGAAGGDFGADLNRRVVFVVETPAGAPSVIPTETTMR